LAANRNQFLLLVLINAFVGAMVGLERTVLPLLAEEKFGLASRGVALSFLVSFGLVKAVANFLAGRLGDLYGRKPILIVGWLVGIPVPFMIMWAPSWDWIIAANVLLGINQGLAWSTTVIMKIDLAGPRRRGLAMGLNEFGGYVAVALSALATGFIAQVYGLRPEPFYLGIAFVAVGLGLSSTFVRETRGHARLEADQVAGRGGEPPRSGSTESDYDVPSTREIFALSTWKHPALSSASQAGLVNNLNDGLAWGLFPLFFAAAGLGVADIGWLVFIYPFTWGILQLWTGTWSDRVGRKRLIAGGMMVQALALASFAMTSGFAGWLGAGALLGAGTAMVYPTLLASVGDVAHPSWRGSAVGVYRLWRDSGYAVGGVMAGTLADAFGMRAAIGVVAVLTALSGLLVAWRMPETLKR
jgi:MFS family permease